MCTAIAFHSRGLYFGRTLDHTVSYQERVVFTPSAFPIASRSGGTRTDHYAILGMARVEEGYPLYFDGFNEKGLAGAALNFTDSAVYHEHVDGRENIAHFDLLGWVLSRCGSVKEAVALLEKTNVTPQSFSRKLPAARLHWIFSDEGQSIAVESVSDGLRIYAVPEGVLANEPGYEMQHFHLRSFMHLSNETPPDRFSRDLQLKPYSLGMGAIGLPGDYTSPSRFVRAAFLNQNAVLDPGEMDGAGQLFHMLDGVSQPLGCCDAGGGLLERTIYSCVCDVKRRIYYYSTYSNRQITAVEMDRCCPDGDRLSEFQLIRQQQIQWQNR